MPIGLPLVLVVVVNLLVGGSVQQVWEEGIRQGVLEVEDAAGPAAPGSVVDRHWAALKVILRANKLTATYNGQRTALLKQDHKLGFMQPGFKGTLLVHPGSCCHPELRRTRRSVWGALFASPSACPGCWGWTQFPACGICKQRISNAFSAALLTLTPEAAPRNKPSIISEAGAAPCKHNAQSAPLELGHHPTATIPALQCDSVHL